MEIKNFVNKSTILFGIIVTLVVVTLFFIKDIALLFFASFVIASAVNPVVNKISKKMPRWAAVSIVYTAGFVILALFCIPFVNVLLNQLISFLNNAPEYWIKFSLLLSKTLNKLPWLMPAIHQFSASFASLSQDLLSRSINLTVSFMGGLAVTFTLAMIVLYMLLDKEQLKQSYLRFFPVNIRNKAEKISVSISNKVGGYVVGQLLSMIAVGLLTTIGLFIFKINFSLLLGAVSGILDIIPVVGPALALGIIILVALGQKPVLVIWAVLVFIIVQWVTNTFFRPVIFSKFLDLHPLVIIFALLVSAAWLGIVGVILSPAIAAMGHVLIEELYLNNINKTES